MSGCTNTQGQHVKEINQAPNDPDVACELKLLSVVRSSMHTYPGNWVAIGRAVVYCARSVQAFSAGIKCQLFYAVSHSKQVTGIIYHPQSNQINEKQIGYAMACFWVYPRSSQRYQYHSSAYWTQYISIYVLLFVILSNFKPTYSPNNKPHATKSIIFLCRMALIRHTFRIEFYRGIS